MNIDKSKPYLRINICEGKDLKATDTNGKSDPLCKGKIFSITD
jgi:Ca2+-dependent lipid-binding protein